ncbi:MAG: hypothetical protein Q4B70_02070 [Lachnospiraceae bacterium]|nr:hypothetical protein [Lachnospiraceae bacterium]
MTIGLERYQNVFESVLREEKINTENLQAFDGEFTRISAEMQNKMTKKLSGMAGTDGQLYTDSEVAIANHHFFKKCMKECCRTTAA